MAISHVGTTFIAGTSGTLPTHQAGDLLLISAFSTTATTPSLPADWTNIASLATPGFRAGYRFAPSAGTASGTWTNAGNGLVVSVYRGVSAVGAVASNKGNSATLTVSGITLEDNGGTSWVVAHMRGYQRMNSVPSGMTMRLGTGDGDYWDEAADTASGVGSFSSRTVAHDVSAQWATLTVELKGAEVQSTSGSETRTETGVGVFSAPTEAGAFAGSKPAGSGAGVFADPSYGQSESFAGSRAAAAAGSGVFASFDTRSMSGAETRTETGVGVFFGASEEGSFAGGESRTHAGYGAFVNPPPPGAILPPARTLDEVIAGSHRTLTRAVIVAGPAAGETLPVTGGGVSVDFDADVTRSGRVTVAGLPQWEPVDATDALDVRAGTEIRLEQGVTDDAGVQHWWSQGVFRPSKPTVTRDAGGLSIDVDLHDRSYSVKLASIRRRWVIAADAPILGSVATVLAEVAPWLPLNIDLTGDFPAGADVVVCEYGGDVWAAARQLAQSMGRWLHVDRYGVCVATPISDPYLTDAQALPALTSEQVGTDTSTIVNVVGATWTEPRPDDAPEGWVPEGGVEEWVDRESSTSIDSAVGVRARAYSGDASVLHTPSHAAQAALSDGLRLRDLSRAASCTVVPDPRLDAGGAVTLDGYTYRLTKPDIDPPGDTPTGVDLGTARPDLARLLGAALRPGQERRLIEVVTAVSPLRTRPIYEEGSEASVRWTDALAGVAVGDRVVVLHKGMGERVGVSLLDPKPLVDKFAGEVIGTVGGEDVTVGGTTTLRARIGSSSYQTFSGGDVTLPAPATTLNWSYASQSTPGTLSNAGSVTTAAFNEDRQRINALNNAVAYINGRLVNLEANNT